MTPDMTGTIGRAWSEAEGHLSYGMELIRLVDGVHTYRFYVGSETQEFDNTDDGYAWQRERKCVSKVGAFLTALDSAGFTIVPTEATPEMVEAAISRPFGTDRDDGESMYADIYSAMINAIPKGTEK